MTQCLRLSFSLLLFALMACMGLNAHASAKSDTLGRLKEWRERTIELNRRAEETQRRELKALTTASLKRDFSTPAGKDAALREIAEPGEDPNRFLESYTRDSSVLNPRSVIEIMESRRYVGD